MQMLNKLLALVDKTHARACQYVTEEVMSLLNNVSSTSCESHSQPVQLQRSQHQLIIAKFLLPSLTAHNQMAPETCSKTC